jgi:hypothetical protein
VLSELIRLRKTIQWDLVTILACGLLLAACPSYSDFVTEGDEVWSGVVVGSEAPESCDSDGTDGEGGPACSFVLRGLVPGSILDLRLSEQEQNGIAGSITIQDDICGSPALSETELRVIEPLEHDGLSLLDFPGQGRIRNTIYAVRPEAGPYAGRDVLAVVSLLREQRVEVRLLSGEGRRCAPSDCDAFSAGLCDLFGIFRLRRENRP